MKEIRGNHPYAFRSGEWAELKGIVPGPDRECYLVEFPDGVTDFWPTHDEAAEYEQRSRNTP